MWNKIIEPSKIERKGKVVLCQGCFDLVHIGHIKHLTAAKSLGDILVVAVTSDRFVNKGPGRPYFNQDLRMEQLASLAIVDHVVLSDHRTAVEIIKEVKPDIFVKGNEYEDISTDITGDGQAERDAIQEVGGVIKFTSEETFSSSEMINKVFSPLTPEFKSFLADGSVNKSSVLNALEAVRNLKVLVIGDAIFDEYCFIRPAGMASKQSYITTRYIKDEVHFGGALATARHIAQVCDNVSLFTSFCPGSISGYDPRIIVSNFACTKDEEIHKVRYLDDSNKILFRVDKGNDKPRSYIDQFKKVNLSLFDVVIINDFGHGFINKELAEYLSTLNTYVCVNTQTNSMNRGFNLITKYNSVDYVSIDLPEARLATGNKEGSSMELAKQINQNVPYKILSITHGKGGTKVYKDNSEVYVPVFSTDIIDATGAGDAYFSITSLLAKIDAPAGIIGFIGNAVGSLATRILGNRQPVDPVLLKKYMIALLK